MNTGKSRLISALGLLGLGLGMAGCGTQGAPQPPSLNLPDPVGDLSAARNGNQVALSWTMPSRNTDKLLLKDKVAVRVCRREGTASCVPVGDLNLAPEAQGSFTETLSGSLTSGSPRLLAYFVELKNSRGRSAGPSNAAAALAGEAPPPLKDVSAAVRKAGVLLTWSAESRHDSIRLHRTLLTPPPAKARAGLLSAPPEPVEQSFLVELDRGRALDKNITFGQTYEYRLQRVARLEVSGKTIELASEFSAPLHVEAKDIFPPAAPTALAAVATAPGTGVEASIDLNWRPVVENDVAGYIVYRKEDDGAWHRISPAQPLTAPDFHDPQVRPGHTYRYTVSAVDQGGHESGRSSEAQEMVPEP